MHGHVQPLELADEERAGRVVGAPAAVGHRHRTRELLPGVVGAAHRVDHHVPGVVERDEAISRVAAAEHPRGRKAAGAEAAVAVRYVLHGVCVSVSLLVSLATGAAARRAADYTLKMTSPQPLASGGPLKAVLSLPVISITEPPVVLVVGNPWLFAPDVAAIQM